MFQSDTNTNSENLRIDLSSALLLHSLLQCIFQLHLSYAFIILPNFQTMG